jgi:hypothetical protein
VEFADFWRTSLNDGKIRPAWRGGGVHAHPLSAYLPSRTKLQCTLQLSGQIHSLMAGSLKVFLEGSGVLNR